MVSQTTKLNIFVASPGDVQPERDRLKIVVDELNNDVAGKLNLVLELITWQTHTYPGMGQDAQDVINKQIKPTDIFIGIMWKRFGTPTKRAASGTVEEFQSARDLWEKNPRTHIMFYFNRKDVPIEDFTQVGKVQAFRKSLSKSALIADYKGVKDFERKVRSHLTKLLLEWNSAPDTGEPAGLPPHSDDLMTGPLTISAVLKGAEHQIIGDAYPTGDRGVHFCFSLFNGNAFDSLVHEVHVDVLAYAPLNLDYLLHGVGATEVERSFQVTIRPELGSYRAIYCGGRQSEYVMIPPSKSEKFDVEITAPTEGLYDVCVRILGGLAGKRFDVLLDSTNRRVAFFDVTAGYMVDRGLGGRMLTYEEYSEEMKSWRKGGY